MVGWEEERNSFNFRFMLFLSIVSNPNVNNFRIFFYMQKGRQFSPMLRFQKGTCSVKTDGSRQNNILTTGCDFIHHQLFNETVTRSSRNAQQKFPKSDLVLLKTKALPFSVNSVLKFLLTAFTQTYTKCNNHNNVLVIIVNIALEIEKVGQYPCPSLLSLATDERKLF